MRRYLRSQDTIDVALGLFEAGASTVLAGRLCRYVVRIANVSEKVAPVKVIIQLSSMTAAHVPVPPSANFAKHWTIPPRCAIAIECHYDWRHAAVFIVDQNTSSPDECWIGEIKTGQCYVVSAILVDEAGKHLDQLDIYQELQG